MQRVALYQVDAFTDRPFTGNPAGVCLLEGALPDATLQAIAVEMNLSETAFVQMVPPGEGRAPLRYGLRWFTPRTEVALCGHATLSAAAVLFGEQGVQVDLVEFDTRSGVLTARRRPEGIQLDFPADPPAPYTLPPAVWTALGKPPVVASLRSPRLGMVLVHVDNAGVVQRLSPDMQALAGASAPAGGMGYIVTAAGRSPADFVSRFFAPALGIPEDPVTGSSHTVLGPYWAGILGRTSLRARQVSARGGDLAVEVLRDGRVGITGQAVVVF